LYTRLIRRCWRCAARFLPARAPPAPRFAYDTLTALRVATSGFADACYACHAMLPRQRRQMAPARGEGSAATTRAMHVTALMAVAAGFSFAGSRRRGYFFFPRRYTATGIFSVLLFWQSLREALSQHMPRPERAHAAPAGNARRRFIPRARYAMFAAVTRQRVIKRREPRAQARLPSAAARTRRRDACVEAFCERACYRRPSAQVSGDSK